MILVDTNVVSELMRPRPSQSVLDWINRRNTLDLYLSTITIAEIGYGLGVMPDGRRCRALKDRFEAFVVQGFAQRIVVFDGPAARHYAEVMGWRREIGRPLGLPDGQIVAIARANHFSVATRNIHDFESCGVEVINPFDDAA